MTTTLSIIFTVLIILNVWIMISSLKRERRRRRKLQERIDEFNKASELHVSELRGAQERVKEAIERTDSINNSYDKLLKKHEKLRADYDALERHCRWYEDAYRKLKATDGAKIVVGEPESEAIVAPRKVSPLALDFQDLKKSYDELAERYENPSKTYLIKNLAKSYNITSGAALAKVLGVSPQSINSKLSKK